MAGMVMAALLAALLAGSAAGQQQDPWGLAALILDDDRADAVEAVSQAYAAAGMGHVRGGVVVRAPVQPALPIVLLGTEDHTLAWDARRRSFGVGRMSLGELADALAAGGWKPGAGLTPGRALLKALRAALDSAFAKPESPHSFVPLFLFAMGQQTGVDLQDPEVRPDQVLLSMLEVQLFLSMHLRPASGTLDRTGPPDLEPAPVLHGPWVAPPGASAPCSELLKQLGAFGPIAQGGMGVEIGKAMGDIYDYLGISKPGGAAIDIAMKVAKIVGSFYDQVAVTLEPELEEAHYGHADSGTRRLAFTFKAEIQGDLYNNDIDRAAADCMAAAGITLPDSRDMLDQQLDGWRVVWVDRGLNGHATVNVKESEFAYAPFTHKLRRTGAYSGSAQLIVDMKNEAPEMGRYTDVQVRHGTLLMRAELDRSQPPNAKVLMDAVTEGLGGGAGLGTAIEMGGELLKKLAPFSATVAVTTSWCEPEEEGWSGSIEYFYLSKIDTAWSKRNNGENDYYRESVQQEEDYQIGIVVDPALSRAGIAYAFESEATTEERQMIPCGGGWNERAKPTPWWWKRVDRIRQRASGRSESVDVSVVGPDEDGSYSVSFTVGGIRGQGTAQILETGGGGCDGKVKLANPTPIDGDFETRGIQLSVEGVANPDNPDQLSGSYPREGEADPHVKVRWTLKRVKGGSK